LAASTVLAVLAVLAVLGAAAGVAPAAAEPARRPLQPPVTPSDFPIEPRGAVPADGDGLIPDAATPDGSAFGARPRCSRIFDSAAGATATTVDAAIANVENRMRAPEVLCLAGTFRGPIHVWGKYSTALLTIAAAPGRPAWLRLGAARPRDVSPFDHTRSDTGAVSITGSRDVAVEGLTISGYHSTGPTFTPAGILVEVRHDAGHTSACFLHGDHACSGIYLLDDTVRDVVNSADAMDRSKRDCGDPEVGAYGIAVLSYGDGSEGALQHVVVEGDTVAHTRTGQSETVAVDGDVTDFLVSANRVYDTDNIGIDTIGWWTGTGQARHGIVSDNVVANVDTWSNLAAGRWNGSACSPLTENAGGIYDDGGAYIWIDHNTVWNTDQGISLDVETPRHTTNHLLVTHNTVLDGPGTSLGDPSNGANPPGIPGRSSVAGHAFDAFYVDAFGAMSTIADVYATGNVFANESQFYGARSPQAAPVIDLGGRWRTVVVWDNVIRGLGGHDHLNPLVEVDRQPLRGSVAVVDCNEYEKMAASPNPNFVLPDGTGFVSLPAWRRGNGHGWDAHSRVDARPACPQLRLGSAVRRGARRHGPAGGFAGGPGRPAPVRPLSTGAGPALVEVAIGTSTGAASLPPCWAACARRGGRRENSRPYTRAFTIWSSPASSNGAARLTSSNR
jgi:hypothetical protein